MKGRAAEKTEQHFRSIAFSIDCESIALQFNSFIPCKANSSTAGRKCHRRDILEYFNHPLVLKWKRVAVFQGNISLEPFTKEETRWNLTSNWIGKKSEAIETNVYTPIFDSKQIRSKLDGSTKQEKFPRPFSIFMNTSRHISWKEKCLLLFVWQNLFRLNNQFSSSGPTLQQLSSTFFPAYTFSTDRTSSETVVYIYPKRLFSLNSISNKTDFQSNLQYGKLISNRPLTHLNPKRSTVSFFPPWSLRLYCESIFLFL